MHEFTNLHKEAYNSWFQHSHSVFWFVIVNQLDLFDQKFFLLLETFFICLCGSVSGLCKLKVVWDKHVGGF